ncbi:MAG: Gfo/Idh/MocA family protein [Anaerolineae bacterium]
MGALPEIRIGLIGYGFIGKVHTLAYQSLPLIYDPMPARVRLVGVSAASRESVQKAIDQAGYAFGSTDWREVITREDIDVIDCCVPNHLHYEVVMTALRAGKHVYCDKPLAANLIQAREMLAEAQRSGKQHRMTFHLRFVPALMRAKQLVEDGFLGQVFGFRACYRHSGYVDPNRPMSWRLDAAAGGGALVDLGSHVLDLLCFLLGDFVEVFAAMETFIKERPLPGQPDRRVPVTVDDLAVLTLRAANGAIGTVEASRLATGTNDEMQVEIYGQLGALRFNLMDPNWLYVFDARDPEAPLGGNRGFKAIESVQRYPAPAVLPGPKFAIGWLRYHIASQFDFITSLVKGQPGPPDFEDGVRVQEIMEAAYRSSRERRWIPLPLL